MRTSLDIAQTYTGDIDNIFIYAGEDKFDEGHIYHKISDRFPDCTDGNRVSKVKLWYSDNDQLVDLPPVAERDLLDFIGKIKKGLVTDTQKVSTGYGNVGLVIYFKNYPATDNSILLMEPEYLGNGKMGLYFSSSELNKKLLNGYENVAITPSKLALEIEAQ